MAQTALFAASVLLCLALGQSLECKECLLDMQGMACLTGTTTCTAKHGQPCMTITIKQLNRKIYNIYGCRNSHRNRCGFSKDGITIECCRDGDMCNRKF